MRRSPLVHALGLLGVAAASGLVVGGLTGCVGIADLALDAANAGAPPACAKSGFSRTFRGGLSVIASASASGASMSSLAAADASATVLDYDPYDYAGCGDDALDLRVEVAGCTLDARTTSQNFVTDHQEVTHFVATDAEIQPNPECVLHLDNTTVTVAIERGTVHIDPATVAIRLAGHVREGAGLAPGAAVTAAF
jgi:hypothetical protein